MCACIHTYVENRSAPFATSCRFIAIANISVVIMNMDARCTARFGCTSYVCDDEMLRHD